MSSAMNAAEIKTRITDLEKAQRDNLPASHFIDILKSLEKIEVNEKLLRETKVGVAVNKCKTNKDKGVAELATKIVMKWKKMVKGPTPSRTGSAPASSNEQKVGATPAAASRSPSIPTEAIKKNAATANGGPGGKGGPRSKESDGINWKVIGDAIRDNCIGMLYDGLCFESDADSAKILRVARDVESAVFKVSNKPDTPYKTKIRALYLNLKDKKNPKLRRRVITGEISPERISTMTSEEMASEERRQEDQKLQAENEHDAMVPTATRSVTDQFVCGKCKKRKVAYSQAQTRSADEPMTTFCECQNCGHRWKFS